MGETFSKCPGDNSCDITTKSEKVKQSHDRPGVAQRVPRS